MEFYNDLQKNKVVDVIVYQRDCLDVINQNLDLFNSILQDIKKKNIKLIFDIDDDLLNIDKKHKDYEKYSNLKNLLEFILINSDIITVSTEYLKNKLITYNENIIVIPNTIMDLWNFNPTNKIEPICSKQTIKIGYFGTRTHGNDIQIIKNAIENVRKKFSDKNIIIETVGISYETPNWITRIKLPNNYKDNPTITEKAKNIAQIFLNKVNLLQSSLPYCSFIDWLTNETEWDIGIAPLEDTNINRSKSNLKYLEYTALNIPGVYSNIGPYKDIGKKNTGIVVNNTTEEWENALINLIEDNTLYETILKNARKDVKKNYMVENSSLIWKQILK